MSCVVKSSMFLSVPDLRSYRGRVSFLPVAEYTSKVTAASNKVLTKVRRLSLDSRGSSKSTFNSEDSNSSVVGSSKISADHSECQLNSERGAGDSFVKLGVVTDEKGDSGCSLREDSSSGNDGGGDASQIREELCEITHESTRHPSQDAYSPSAHINGCSVQHNHSITIFSDAEEISVEQETYHVRKPKSAPVPTPLLQPLDQDVPANWVSLDENFILAIAVYKTHLGSEMLVAPDAHLADGHIHLIMIKEGISRNALLNLFLNFDQGRHINSPYVDVVKVLAFRIEPATKSGNLMVDGERFDPAPIQGQILPGVARVMAIK